MQSNTKDDYESCFIKFFLLKKLSYSYTVFNALEGNLEV